MTSLLLKLLQLPKYLLLLSLAATISCCNKDDDSPPPQPVDLLPPATQTGAGTFGCLLDGEVFLPGRNTPNPLDCVYQYVDGGYYFELQGNRRNNGIDYERIAIGTNRLEIYEGGTFLIKEDMPGNALGIYIYIVDTYKTTETCIGELRISKLDFDNHIVSGTFWFDVKDSNGVKHEIREGRFDVRFTE